MRALWLLFPLTIVACGGESDDGAGTGGKGGSSAASGSSSGGKGGSTGGTSATGGKGGSTGGGSGTAGTSGDGGTAGVGMACCLAFPTCGEGEEQIDSLDDCPALSTCHEVSLCCSTIVCAEPAAQCEAIPTCDEGDTEVKICPEDISCYERSLCGTTIVCRDDACDPDSEYNRNYVAMGDTCLLVDFVCPENTDYFYNDCGCGCEQDASCPEFVDCMPGGDVPPACSDETECPFTVRAL